MTSASGVNVVGGCKKMI